MKKHLIIIASIFILLGTTLGILFVVGHINLFSAGAEVFPDNSVLNADRSTASKWVGYFNAYMEFFAQFGINPLFSLFTIGSSISFGYGLLKRREWARRIGFVIIALNVFSSLYAIFGGFVSGIHILQLALAAYMWWALTSEETKSLISAGK